MDPPCLSAGLCLSPVMCPWVKSLLLGQPHSVSISWWSHLCAVSCSCSDLPKFSQLPVAMDTGCLWLLGGSLWSHFLVDKSDSILKASGDGNLGVDIPVIGDLRTPTLLRAITSLSVNSFKLPAVPGNSMCIFANGPMVTNGTSSPVRGSRHGTMWS